MDAAAVRLHSGKDQNPNKPWSVPYYSRFYAQAVMIEALLRVVAPGSLWGERLADLLAQHPKVRLDRLGFPEGWQQRAVWTG